MTRFEGKVVLVTGSSRNIGKAIATAFAEEGATVVLNARESADELAAAATDLRARGHHVLPILANLADREAVDRMVDRAIAELGHIDVLMITHSVRPRAPFLELTDEEWHDVMAINLHSRFYLLRAVLPHMVANGGGSVIAIAGDPSRIAMALPAGRENPRPHVFAALGGAGVLLRCIQTEFASKGIRFNYVEPGVMATFRKNPEWYPDSPPEGPHMDEALLATIPLRRAGRPEEIADAVLWLASAEAEYVVGTTIGVNGGWGR